MKENLQIFRKTFLTKPSLSFSVLGRAALGISSIGVINRLNKEDERDLANCASADNDELRDHRPSYASDALRPLDLSASIGLSKEKRL